MGSIPSSMVAAVACSAAAGKNPWLPLALIFLLAAPDSVPSLMMDAELHRQLHGLGPVELLWSLGALFAVLAVADSLGDKLGFIEKWLVPVSTAWRPFAGIACASLVGVAAARDVAGPEPLASVAAAVEHMRADPMGGAQASLWVGGSVVALTVAVAAVYGWIATMGKTGARLLMTMVPVPGLKLAHSFVDDFFALAATFAGLAFADTFIVVGLLIVYLAVGLLTAPILTRLTAIHLRVGCSVVRKGWRKMRGDGDASSLGPAPRWVRRWMDEQGLEGPTALPAYVYRAPELGRCRAGHLVLAPGCAIFLTRIWWRPRAWRVGGDRLARVGLADTATSRVVTLVERLPSGALREGCVYLYPAAEDEVLPALERGAARAGLCRVRADSESARAGLPGYADRGRSVRFLPPEAAGSLRLQGAVTVASALVGGLLTGGVFVPIGTGYLLSPFKLRWVLGWAVSGYLSLCVLGTMGLGWPAAVLYAGVLNALALRDLTRQAIRARVDGFVDRRSWLPPVAGHVWVPAGAVQAAGDRWIAEDEDDEEPLTEGGWRTVAQLLSAPA